jgi:hypothetical protein
VKRRLGLAISLFLIPVLGACDNGMQEIAHPFYLGRFEASGPIWLFRCPNGPDDGCANDSLPDGDVLAAGANKQFVVFQMSDGYYYFRRIPLEANGWGDEPEKIIGPIDENGLAKATKNFGLPRLTIKP